MENKKYIVYIDESNILSKIDNSVYVALFIESRVENSVTCKIINIENDLKVSYLHWVDIPWKLRINFTKKIKTFDFICKIIVYKNPINQENTLEDFLYRIIKLNKNIYKIIIDGNKGEGYERKLKRLLKNKGVRFNRVIFKDDKKEPLLRLADFMAGMYRSYIDNKNKENSYMFGILKHKIKILN